MVASTAPACAMAGKQSTGCGFLHFWCLENGKSAYCLESNHREIYSASLLAGQRAQLVAHFFFELGRKGPVLCRPALGGYLGTTIDRVPPNIAARVMLG